MPAAAPQADTTCDIDFQVALQHFFGNEIGNNNPSSPNGSRN